MPAKPLTDEQKQEAREVYKRYGSQSLAAEALGISRPTLQNRLRGGSSKNNSQFANSENSSISGTSTLLDKDGNTVLKWVKTRTEDKKDQELQEAVYSALADKLPRCAPIAAPKTTDSDLITTYVITDYHFGMMAWREETGGEDWDIKKAEQLLVQWFRLAIDHAPASEHCVFAQLGDFLHWDGMNAITPEHGNLLDADTRFAKLVRVVIRVVRQVINMLAEKHKFVHVIMADANHDPASEIWLREWLAAIYEDNDRITVEQSADSFYCVEHGLTSLFFHHGHKRRVNDVDGVFAAKFREVFGRTKHSYAHLGHLHSNEVKETGLMQVERHRTLCAPDAYSAKGGWVSGRDAKVITYHKKFGEVHRMTINPDMVRAV